MRRYSCTTEVVIVVVYGSLYIRNFTVAVTNGNWSQGQSKELPVLYLRIKGDKKKNMLRKKMQKKQLIPHSFLSVSCLSVKRKRRSAMRFGFWLSTKANELAQWPNVLIYMLFRAVLHRVEGNKQRGHYGGNWCYHFTSVALGGHLAELVTTW